MPVFAETFGFCVPFVFVLAPIKWRLVILLNNQTTEADVTHNLHGSIIALNLQVLQLEKVS